MSALATAAVPSGRKTISSPPWSTKLYISFCIISEVTPKVFLKTFEFSIIGVFIS